MLGRTAGGLFWMFRNLERAENSARLIDAGFRIALTSGVSADSEWSSIAATAGITDAYLAHHREFEGRKVIDFLLRDRRNPSSALSCIEMARSNARAVRTALTREVFEATNDCFLTLKDVLGEEVHERMLPETLALIRQHTAQVRGAVHGTMLRNDIFDFCMIGSLLERADNTARILDVKYYLLLPSPALIGTSADNAQWEMILRSVSAQRSFRWLNSEATAYGIAEFLMLDRRMPRSLAYCCSGLVERLRRLAAAYGAQPPALRLAEAADARLTAGSMDDIFAGGLHEFLGEFVAAMAALGRAIEQDFRFYE